MMHRRSIGSLLLSFLPALAPKASYVEPNISAAFPFQSQFVTVRGSKIHYVDEGDGEPIVLFHGNPTSSYLWRNIIPVLARSHRVIAFDMIGMGKSDKPVIDYSFADHAAYLTEAINALGLHGVTLVGHDWGGGVALDYAARHPDNVKSLAFLEAMIRPIQWSDANIIERFMFGRLRAPDEGQRLVGEENYFLEKMLPMMTGRTLSPAEAAAYNAPYLRVEDRKPLWVWPLELPIAGEPADTNARVQENYDWLCGADTPVLLLAARPGAIGKPAMVKRLESEIPRLEVKSIGPGLHYVQETSPSRVASALSDWIAA